MKWFWIIAGLLSMLFIAWVVFHIFVMLFKILVVLGAISFVLIILKFLFNRKS